LGLLSGGQVCAGRRCASAGRVTPRAVLPDLALSSYILSTNPQLEHATLSSPSIIVAKTETREGIYGEYQVTVPDRNEAQEARLDDAKSTFKSRAQTKKNRNKYVGIFAVLLVGSFIIPMVQYFWYVRDTPGSLFGPKNEPPPPPPPKKKNFWER